MDLHDIALAAALAKGSGGGTPGTTDYTDLTNKPSINSVTLSGNKSFGDLGMDTAPTENHSAVPVSSGGVYSALARLDATTGDIYFGQACIGRVMDSSSYEALVSKDNIWYATYPTPAVNANVNSQRSETSEIVEDEMRTEEDPIDEPQPEDDMR